MSEFHRMFAALQTSAEAHGLHPQILGYGKKAWWPEGLGVKINVLRNFAQSHNLREEDIVVCADAFDVLVFADEEEIVRVFLDMERRHGRSLFFNAEVSCFPAIDGLCEDYPPSPTHLRYLNSGLIVGRVWALRHLLKDPVSDVMEGGDQHWYQRQFRSKNRSGLIALDQECRFFCTVTESELGTGLELAEDRRLVWSDTGCRPALVHFAGAAHWPQWPKERDRPTTLIADLFLKLYPDVAARLLGGWDLALHMGSTQDIQIYKGDGFWSTMALVLCMRCNVLRWGHPQCEPFRGFLCPRCVFWSMWAFGCCVLMPLSCALVWLYRPSRLRVILKSEEHMV